MSDPPPKATRIADYGAVLLSVGIVTFVCAMIWLDWRETGELNSWMLSTLLVLVVLAVGTLFGFGRMEQALEVVGIDFGGKD